MARPRKDAAGPSAEQRIHQAFWELIAEMPLERITVGDLAARAGCNRGTFYYYYDDIYALLDAVIDANLPKELPSFLFSHFTGASASPASDREPRSPCGRINPRWITCACCWRMDRPTWSTVG